MFLEQKLSRYLPCDFNGAHVSFCTVLFCYFQLKRLPIALCVLAVSVSLTERTASIVGYDKRGRWTLSRHHCCRSGVNRKPQRVSSSQYWWVAADYVCVSPNFEHSAFLKNLIFFILSVTLFASKSIHAIRQHDRRNRRDRVSIRILKRASPTAENRLR